MSHDNGLRTRGNLNFYVPAATYGMAESCHATILHHWMDLVSETVAAGLHDEKARNFFDNCVSGQFQPK
jgi:D-sedoheptulose 7-phosphate isomerase